MIVYFGYHVLNYCCIIGVETQGHCCKQFVLPSHVSVCLKMWSFLPMYLCLLACDINCADIFQFQRLRSSACMHVVDLIQWKGAGYQIIFCRQVNS